MAPHLFHHQWRNSPEMFLKWGVISYLNGVLSWVNTPELCWVQQKYIMILSKELACLFPPIWGPMSPSHLNLTHQTVYHAFAWSLTLELESQNILPLEPVDSQAWGSRLATVLVLPLPLAFFPKDLGIGSVVLHYHHCLLTALPQFSICVLHG